jgi:hypothetical protein
MDKRVIQNDEDRMFSLLAGESLVGLGPEAVVIMPVAETEAMSVGVGVAVDVDKLVV